MLITYDQLTSGADLTASLKEAYGPSGLGILVVSGIPQFPEYRAQLLPLARKFALLPEEVKLKYEHAASHYNFGWSHGKETLAGKPDLAKGSYYANPLYDAPFEDAELIKKFPSFCAPNIWPTADLPELEPAFKQLGKLICDTGNLLASHCDKYAHGVNPSYAPDRLTKILTHSRTAKARLLHYFPMTVEQAKDASGGPDVDGSWCGWHNDHGSLTGLCSAMYFNEKGEEIPNPDPNSGLYIRSRTGATVKAVIPADCLAFQMGETEQIHSCGALQATPHCVMAGAVPNVSRETFAVFMEPEMFEPMTVPADCDTQLIIGGTSDYLPKGVPPLKVRWNNEQDFGTFTNATLAAYHPEEQNKA